MEQQLTFYDRAARYGHSAEALKAGKTITTIIAIDSVDELRAFFQKNVVKGNSDLVNQLFTGISISDPDSDNSAQAILRRVNEFVYGETPLSEKDRLMVRSAFPLEIEITSKEKYTPTAPLLVNSPTKPAFYNWSILTLNQGIYITVYNTVAIFDIDTVIRNGNNGNAALADFNIFGATGTAGTKGDPGSKGGTGTSGSKGTCVGGGGISGDPGGPGGTGNTGGTGGPGNPGNQGLPSYQATITINQGLTGNLYFFTRSGTGGAGGQGGDGGAGGNGGNGGKGATCGCENTNGGNAGNGGTGGTGGLGGNGANGINAAANIVVIIPSSIQAQVFKNSDCAPFGTFGPGGVVGIGGPPGSPGGGGGASGCPSGDDGSKGSTGGNGSKGNNGNPGTIQGNPATISFQVV